MRKRDWFGLIVVLAGCARGPAVLTQSTLPLRRVVIYRNGVGYFEREGSVRQASVEFRVRQSEVGDFLATLAVMERGGSSVQSAAFPLPDDAAQGGPPRRPDERRSVRLALDGRAHDLTVGYMVETPIWRPSYRLVFGAPGARGVQGAPGAQVQAWGIVQNISGEDWSNVRLSLVSGSPVSFRSELAEPMLTERPLVTDRGEVLDVVPHGDTTLAQEQQNGSPNVNREAAERAASQRYPTTTSASAPAGARPMAGASSGIGSGRGGGTGGLSRHYARRSRASADSGGGDEEIDGATVANDVTATVPNAPMLRPRSVASLAAVAVQGGTTRYDLPNAVTVPNQSATMVLLAARDVPGERVYLFAPEGGVPASTTHPFHVARFENHTGAMLERGPVAIFEQGAFLGQGMLDPLPDRASATVPFALERAIAVESSATNSVDGSRLLRIQRGEIAIERYRVNRTRYNVRNGMDHEVRVMMRHALATDMQLFQPPPGVERANGAALVPVRVPMRNHSEIEVVTRVPYAQATDWNDENAAIAIEGYLRDGHATQAVADVLRQALEFRRTIVTAMQERVGLVQRREDLENNSEETRQNLEAIRRNPGAADLRARLTTRLSQVATQIDQATRRIVELDTQMGERRVRLLEAVRTLDINTAAPAARPAVNPVTGAP